MAEIVLPFLKWAGGKRWLCAGHSGLFPSNYQRYIEPFLGSGAVFFHLRPTKSVLADSNPELIETYRSVRKDWETIERLLAKHQKHHNKDYYYKIRNADLSDPYEKAARFIYLNRTCWNGLYRVNLKGKFNVPVGTKTAVVLRTDNFRAVSKLLSKASLFSQSFEKTIESAGSGDFIFVDPPYTVNHNYNGFLKYNEKIFSWDDQEKLASCLISAHVKGAKILLTNADNKSIKALYSSHFELVRLHRHSIISGNSKFRNRTTEIIIKNY